jgi:hypothetical protein
MHVMCDSKTSPDCRTPDGQNHYLEWATQKASIMSGCFARAKTGNPPKQ